MLNLILLLLLIVSTTAFLNTGFKSVYLKNNGLIGKSSSRLWLSTADFKNGMTIEIDGTPFKILEFLHVKPGKGAAFVRSKIKNMTNGSVQEKTFRAGETFDAAQVEKVEMQYTYDDGPNFAFMNMDTFEEQLIEGKKIENKELLIPGVSVSALIWNGQVIDVALPSMMEFEVVECPPNFKGNTAQGAMKPATLEGGAVVQVPMFIETGEKIRIDTNEMKYVSRAEK